jgi:hypothetical protein
MNVNGRDQDLSFHYIFDLSSLVSVDISNRYIRLKVLVSVQIKYSRSRSDRALDLIHQIY